jgi:hypothetical protein
MRMVLPVLFLWLVVGAVTFCALAALTPNNDLDRASPEWMAILALLWPIVVLFIIAGALLALIEILWRNKRA